MRESVCECVLVCGGKTNTWDLHEQVDALAHPCTAELTVKEKAACHMDARGCLECERLRRVASVELSLAKRRLDCVAAQLFGSVRSAAQWWPAVREGMHMALTESWHNSKVE